MYKALYATILTQIYRMTPGVVGVGIGYLIPHFSGLRGGFKKQTAEGRYRGKPMCSPESAYGTTLKNCGAMREAPGPLILTAKSSLKPDTGTVTLP